MEGILNAILSSSTITAMGIAAMIIFFGAKLLLNMDKDGPLAEHAIQLAGLIIILPVLLVLALVADLSNEALTGFLGTIVGYFFGVSKDK